MAKRCKRNGNLEGRFALDTKPLQDKIGHYLHVCMLPSHRHVLTDLRYVKRRCLRNEKKPCPHYRRFREESILRLYPSVREVEVRVAYSEV